MKKSLNLFLTVLIINIFFICSTAAEAVAVTPASVVPASSNSSKAKTTVVATKASSTATAVTMASASTSTLASVSTTTTTTNSSLSTTNTVAILAYGNKGYNVTQLQSKLKKIGYFKAAATGNFLTETKKAVIKFQKNNKLTPSGIVGILTWNSINKRINAIANNRGGTTITNKLTVFNRILKTGCSGSDVSELQDKLIKLGLLSGKKDGIYGKLTYNAVKAFQTYKKLAVTGIADELTISFLINTNSIPKDFFEIPSAPINNSSDENPVTTLPTTPTAIDLPVGPTATPTPTPTPTPISVPSTTGSALEIPIPSATDSEIPNPENNTTGPIVTDPTQTQKPLLGKTVIIDPGHGFSDPGVTRSSVYEKTISLNIGLKLKKLLEASGATVIMTRMTDGKSGSYYLYYRSAVANKSILQKEISKLEKEISDVKQKIDDCKISIDTKKAEIDGINDNLSDVNNQKDIDFRLQLQQEYNELLQNSTSLEATLNEKQNSKIDLEQKSESFDYYIADPALKERIGIYEHTGAKAGSDLTKVFDLENTACSKDTIFISIHNNSTEANETSASGVKVYVSDKTTSYYSSYYSNYNQTLRDKLGTLLLSNLNVTTSFSKKTTKITKSSLSVLRENNLVSALIEVGFLNNSSDRKLLLQNKTLDNSALGMLNGIKAYFNEVNK